MTSMTYEAIRIQGAGARPLSERSCFVLGTAFRLRAYALNGTERWNRQVPGDTWGVDLSLDGRIIVAAYGDGTIRWRRWSDGAELLALFVDAPTKRWVAWTPAGYYICLTRRRRFDRLAH